MTAGQVAGLIAATSFLIFGIIYRYFLNEDGATLSEVNKSVKTMTEDLDVISKHAEDIF